MKILDAIQQTKPFASAQEEALVNLLFTYGWIMETSRKILRPYGITPTQYNILRILKGSQEPISTSDIRTRMLDKNSDASRAVDRLRKKGWVVKRQCPTDKRLIDVELSEAGLTLMNELEPARKKLRASTERLTDKEAKVLSELLDKIRNQ